jgi:predicted RNA-binding Zn-ribbon protein involved in translation (DUF1610 family)
MTTIRTTCPRCGEVDMGPEAIVLSVERGGSEGSYHFVCPECQGPVEKRADRKIVALMVSAGVDVSDQRQTPTAVQSRLDQVIEEPPHSSDAPAFTMDDVIELHYLLEDPHFCRRLLDGS